MSEKTEQKKTDVFMECSFRVVDNHIEAECTSMEAAQELIELLGKEVIIRNPATVRKPKVFSSEVVTCSHYNKDGAQAVLIIYDDGYVSILCRHKKDDLCQPCRYEEK